MDIDQYSALCYGDACQAWIEESEYEDDKINCGWPQTRFIKQNNTLEEVGTKTASTKTKAKQDGGWRRRHSLDNRARRKALHGTERTQGRL